jgi:hypothetical protein
MLTTCQLEHFQPNNSGSGAQAHSHLANGNAFRLDAAIGIKTIDRVYNNKLNK